MNIVFPNNITEKEKDKKRKELKVIQSILFNTELLKEEDITIYCDEEPDFNITTSEGRKIGLEVTKYFPFKYDINTENENELRKVCIDTLERVQIDRIIEDDFNPQNELFLLPPRIRIFFNHSFILNGKIKKNKATIENELITWVEYNRNKTTYPNTNIIEKVEICTTVKENIKSSQDLELHNKNNHIVIDIYSSMMYLISHIDKFDNIWQNTLKDKEEKLKGYKLLEKNKDIKEWWLCIEVPRTANVKTIGYKLPQNIKTDYDNIYIYSEIENSASKVYPN